MASEKENGKELRKSYAGAALQRKLAAAAGGTAALAAGTQLPRVAALAAGTQLRASLAAERSTTQPPRPAPRASVSAPRMGFKPATHSTRTLVPLADVTAPTRVLAPPSAASKAAPACGATPEPAPSLISSTIGDPGLDDAEAELQAELAMADRRLETLQQQVQRRSATPEPGAAASVGAREVPWVAAPPQHARQHAAPQATPSAAPAPQQEQLGPPPAASPPPIPPSDMSIVRTVTTATGTGCKDVLAAHATVLLPPGACWTSRGHRVLHLESSCILQLYGRTTSEITLRITFAEAASVPRIVRLEHAPSTSAAFERLGDIKLQEKSLKQLRHLFRLGRTLEVQRFLRITLVGHMAEPHSGAHRVSHMLLTSALGPQRSQSAQSQATAPASAGVAASAQASVDHGRRHETPTSRCTASATAAAPAAAPPAQHAAQSTTTAPGSSVAGAPALAPVHSEVAPAPVPALSPSLRAAEQGASPATSSATGHGPASAAASVHAGGTRWHQVHNAKAPPAVAWGALDNAEAELDFDLLAAEFGGVTLQPAAPAEAAAAAEAAHSAGMEAPESPPHSASSSAGAPPVMLLPMQRCGEVGSVLERLGLTPEQAKQALLRAAEPEQHADAPVLSEEDVAELLCCLPSGDEQAVLAGGCPSQLGPAEQFMLEVMDEPAVVERVEAAFFASQATARAEGVAAAAAVLDAACAEVARCNVLRTLLKVAGAAGNFLSAGNQNGAAAGFQIDALLLLKDVKSSRARTRTLLNVVARQVAATHPEGACLMDVLPSAAAAAGVDLQVAKAELAELAAGARRVEEALGAAGAAAPLAGFRAEVVERLGEVEVRLAEAEAAFKHLGSFINGQRSTLAAPAAFFGVLQKVAEELADALAENAVADAGAGPSKSSGSTQDAKPRCGRSSPGGSTASLDQARGRQGSIGAENSSAAGGQGSDKVAARFSDKGALLERLKQVSAGRRQPAGSLQSPGGQSPVASQRRRQHSPQPCLSKAAIDGIGGSRRGDPMSSSGGVEPATASPPAVSSVDAAALLAATQTSQGAEAGGDAAAAGTKLSTPVAHLLAESARLISSMDGTDGGFGSAIGSLGSGAPAPAAVPVAAAHDTAATPDGAIKSVVAGEDDDEEEEEEEGGYSTPRGAVSLRWLEQQQQQPVLQVPVQAAAQQQVYVQQQRQAGPPAAGAAAAVLKTSRADSLASRGSLSQLRQRSLQKLSPTSTPLSSLGRQSSQSSSGCCSDGASTPRSSARVRGSLLRRSASPLGLGATVAEMEAAAAHCLAAGVPPAAAAQRASLPGHLLPAEPAAAMLAPRASQQQQALPFDSQAAHHTSWQAAAEEGQEDAALPSAQGGGFGKMHSRASSCDLTFYAPFSMDREGQSAFVEAPRGLAATHAYGREPATAWGPLAAQQRVQQQQQPPMRPSGLVRHISADACVLARVAAEPAVAGQRRIAFSVPTSPTHRSSDVPSANRRPAPLNLRGVTDRLQLHVAQQQAAAGSAGASNGGSLSHQPRAQRAQHMPQLSPVLESLLASVPTPMPPQQADAELAEDDLADLAGFTSDHELEWQQLESLEQRDAALQAQQVAAREAREAYLCGQLAAAAAAPWAGQPPAASMGVQQEDVYAAEQEARQLAALPSPLNSATIDFDAAVARLLASAGNTPTGPLGQGVRGPGETFAGSAGLRASSGVVPQRQHMALLEPVLPAPLGEGVRASHAMSERVPAAALRMSIEGPRAMLHSSASAPAGEQAAAAGGGDWHAAAAGQQAGYCEHSLEPGAPAGFPAAAWEAGVGPMRRRRHLGGLRRLLGGGGRLY